MKNLKALWIIVAFACATLALIALAGQAVTARPASHELKPPFNFVQQPPASRPEASSVPPGSTVLMTETFGAAFTATTSLAGTTPLWRVAVNTDDTAGYYWNKVGASSPVTFTNSAWSAARLLTATQVLTPGVSTYPAGQDSWLVYGPIDLSKFSYAHLSFSYYLDSQAGDTLLWGYSFDGDTFYGNTQSGPLSEWITNTFTFRATPAYQSVYVAFAFNSHTNPQGKGAFIRNVRLTGEPIKYTYLSLVANNYAAPTPTPIPPLFDYTFNPGNTDIDSWGGKYSGIRSGSGGTYAFGQCLPGDCSFVSSPHGNPANSLRLYNTSYWVMTASSPNNVAPDDFELNVDISPWQLYSRDKSCGQSCPPDNLGNWYGIIFNASGNTFGATPAQFNYNGQYYRVYFYTIDATKPIGVKLDRCNNGNCVNLRTRSLPSGVVGGTSAIWDHIQIVRKGAALEVSANGTVLLTATDATYSGSAFGKFGVFIFPSDGNAVQYPPSGYQMQVDFDNLKLYGN